MTTNEVVEDWRKYYSDVECILRGYNKVGYLVEAIRVNNNIYLVNEIYNTIMYAPKIMFHFVNKEHIHIDDVLMKTDDIGNGTIAMTALIEYCLSIGVKTITGDLSEVDNDHKERRDYFYKKMGFTVSKKSIKREL